jgi:aspartate aminotransferase
MPYWVSYPEQIKLAGGIVKTIIPEGPDLKITAAQLERSLSPKTKAIILNSPSNPSGAVYTKAELTSIVRVLKNSGIYVISDEIYDKILFDNLKYTSMTVFDEIRDQLVYINGVSKSYAMTGWRIGFLAAHQSIVSAVVTYQGHSITHPSTISQKAALEAYRSEHSFINEMVRAYQHRRDYVMQRLAAIKNVTCIRPQGAFYAFPDLSWYYTKDMSVTNSLELCYYLLEHFGVATVPGAAFGMDQHVRLSYATSLDILEKALDRIQSGLESLAR